MSSGPLTVVDVGMYGAGVAPKVGYTNGNDGAMPLYHVGTFLRACSDYRCSLLIFVSCSVMHATHGTAGTVR